MLEELFARIWQYLTALGRSPFSLLQGATIGLDGKPKVRTLVLREASKIQHSVTFFTDKRSTKVAELRKNPSISLLGFDPAGHVQLRMEGIATFCTDETKVLEYWKESRAHSRALYLSSVAPGSPIKMPARYQANKNTCSTTSDGYENFCVVYVSLEHVEWLELSQAGYSRADFKRSGTEWQGQWVAP